MNKIGVLWRTVACAILLAGNAWATDDAGELVNDAARATPVLQLDPDTLEDRWMEWVSNQPWGAGRYSGSVQEFPERGIYVSFGTAHVSTRMGQPGWIESRMIAYEQADLEARSRLVDVLNQKLSTGRSLDFAENPDFWDGVVQDMKDISEIRRTLNRWGKKTVRLTDAVLDRLISLADEDYDPDTLNAMPPEKQKVILEELFSKSLSRVLTQALAGVAVIYTSEGRVGEEYQVLVGIIWSPNLSRVAWGIRNDSDTPLMAAKGVNVNQWIASLDTKLLGIWGTRVVVDDQGHFNVVAFAQAEPARAALNRQNAAIHRAKEIAENRARALIVNFVAEKVVLKSNQDSQQIHQEREDTSSGTEITRRLRKVVQGRRQTLNISGLHTVKRWSATHPLTGQKLAGAVVVWSPSSRDMARRMAQSMKGPQSKPKSAPPAKKKAPVQKPQMIESVTIDTSAY